VRVSQGGSKTFILIVGSGKRRTIGRFGIISLSKAREEARRILAEKTLGIKAPEVKKGTLFDTAVTAFIEEHYRSAKPRTKHEAKRLLSTRFPGLKRKFLSEISDADVNGQLERLANTPSEQLHAFRALRVFFKWCMRPPHRYLKHNPLEGYPAPGKDKKGSRILSDYELARVWNACEGFFGDMIRLLILWGCRNGEISRLHRHWRDGSVITIPGASTKNGRAQRDTYPADGAIDTRSPTGGERLLFSRPYQGYSFQRRLMGEAEAGARQAIRSYWVAGP
jgi:integrase